MSRFVGRVLARARALAPLLGGTLALIVVDVAKRW